MGGGGTHRIDPRRGRGAKSIGDKRRRLGRNPEGVRRTHTYYRRTAYEQGDGCEGGEEGRRKGKTAGGGWCRTKLSKSVRLANHDRGDNKLLTSNSIQQEGGRG